MPKETNQPDLYLIPGLGGDARLFEGLRREGLEFKVLEFIRPKRRETLAQYARRMAESIDTDRPFVIGGVSLGGMLSVEIAKATNPEKVVLISSVKNRREFPLFFKVGRFIPVHRLVSGELWKKYAPRERTRDFEPWQAKALAEMRVDADPYFIRWAVHAVLHWRNREVPENLVHIHGTEDRMFPSRWLGKRIEIPQGKHVMVLTRAKELVPIIRNELTGKDPGGAAKKA